MRLFSTLAPMSFQERSYALLWGIPRAPGRIWAAPQEYPSQRLQIGGRRRLLCRRTSGPAPPGGRPGLLCAPRSLGALDRFRAHCRKRLRNRQPAIPDQKSRRAFMEELICLYKLYFFSIGRARPPALTWFLAGLAAGGNRG